MRDPRMKDVAVFNKHGSEKVALVPEAPKGEIHIYKGHCGYKLSIGERHLTLPELAYVVDKINAIYRLLSIVLNKSTTQKEK